MVLSARSDVVPIHPSQLSELVSGLVIGNTFQAAILTLLVYDTIITFDKEVKHFWKIPRKVVDFIYFINRYVGIFGAVTSLYLGTFAAVRPLCNFSTWSRDIASWISIVSIDYILMIRVIALYTQDRKLSICLKTLLVLEATFRLGVIVSSDLLQHNVVGVFEDISICALNAGPRWQLEMVDWLIPLVYGIILMVLALYKAVEYWRLSAGFKGFTLVKVLIEDQIVYFALAISCSVFSILEFKLQFSNNILANIVNQLGSPSILCLLGSRMLLNTKEAGDRGQVDGTSYQSTVLKDDEDGTCP